MGDNRIWPGYCGACGGELDSEGWCANYCMNDEVLAPLPVAPARLDADGTAKPLTKIVHHPKAGARSS